MPLAHVEAERHAPHFLTRALPHLDEAGDHSHRQVVDTVEAQVLEHLDGGALDRAGEPGHHHEAELVHMMLGARPLLARCARCAAPMPPDPVGQNERFRARPPTMLGARPLLARCAAPMPPDPVGQNERFRARPPSVLAAAILARPPTTSHSLTRSPASLPHSDSPARWRWRAAISSSRRSAKASALCRPRARRRWLRAAVSISIAMLRPGRTGTRTRGSSTSSSG